MAGFIALPHVAGWLTLVALVEPEHYSLGEKAVDAGGVQACRQGAALRT
ncbi:hypothetical protein [Streptomyces sp. NPDC031705]